MKRTIFYSMIAIALAASIAFVVKAQHNAATENCPCTPDCQPGDPHCTCPVGCEK